MPWNNVPESKWPAMERCVEDVMAQGRSKESATAICYRSVVEGATIEELMKQFDLESLTLPAEVEAEMQSDFLFVDLANLIDGKAFDGLAPGEFIDAHGQTVSLKSSDLAAIVANTQKAIDATKTEGGEVVGLPIDARNHDKGDAAGWIVGVELEGETVRLLPRWTAVGMELISKGIQRFFSATLDLANKVLYGGTLTNWPATRDKKGKVLLRPIELSTNLYRLETKRRKVTMEPELTQEQQDAIVEQLKSKVPELTDLSQAKEAIFASVGEVIKAEYAKMQTDLKATADAKLAEMIADYKADQQIAELAQRLAGGSEKAPRGLPVPQAELEEFIKGLNPEQRKKAQEIFAAIVEKGLVEFAEIGHGRSLTGVTPLPEWAEPILADFVAKGGTLAKFFDLNAVELGEMSSYDLSKYEKKE